MSLLQQIDSDIKMAMLNKQTDKLRALRGLKSALQLKATEKPNVILTFEDEIQTIQKCLKTRRESEEIYATQNRPDLVKIEKDEISILEEYLPKQLTTDEVTLLVEEVILETEASSIKDMGKVIGLVIKKVAGKSDNKTVSDIVKKLLT